LLSNFNREEDRSRRACLRQGGILHSGVIRILLLVTLMTSMQTVTQLPNYASARITPSSVVGSIQSDGMSALPTSISPNPRGQPIVPTSGDTFNEEAQNTTGIKAVFLFSQVNRQRLTKLAEWVDQYNIKVNIDG